MEKRRASVSRFSSHFRKSNFLLWGKKKSTHSVHPVKGDMFISGLGKGFALLEPVTGTRRSLWDVLGRSTLARFHQNGVETARSLEGF